MLTGFGGSDRGLQRKGENIEQVSTINIEQRERRNDDGGK